MKYIIIGGVAGGASTAARLRRLDERAEILLFEKGEYISYANCGLPYYIGGVISDRERLFVQTPESFANRFGIGVKVLSEVTRIDPERKKVEVKDLKSGEVYEEGFDKLVLSVGAEPDISSFGRNPDRRNFFVEKRQGYRSYSYLYKREAGTEGRCGGGWIYRFGDGGKFGCPGNRGDNCRDGRPGDDSCRL